MSGPENGIFPKALEVLGSIFVSTTKVGAGVCPVETVVA